MADKLEKPLQMKNVGVIISKVKSDIAKILGDHTLNENMITEDFELKIREHILMYLPMAYDDFDIKLFDLILVPVPDKPQTLSIQPQNFITALWMQGVKAPPSVVEGMDIFVNDMVTYRWDDEKKLLKIELHINTNMP